MRRTASDLGAFNHFQFRTLWGPQRFYNEPMPSSLRKLRSRNSASGRILVVLAALSSTFVWPGATVLDGQFNGVQTGPPPSTPHPDSAPGEDQGGDDFGPAVHEKMLKAQNEQRQKQLVADT